MLGSDFVAHGLLLSMDTCRSHFSQGRCNLWGTNFGPIPTVNLLWSVYVVEGHIRFWYAGYKHGKVLRQNWFHHQSSPLRRNCGFKIGETCLCFCNLLKENF